MKVDFLYIIEITTTPETSGVHVTSMWIPAVVGMGVLNRLLLIILSTFMRVSRLQKIDLTSNQ